MTTSVAPSANALDPEQPGLRIPVDHEAFAPAQTELVGEGDLDGAQLADTRACAGCHASIFEQQQRSTHAISSFNNPIYRAAIDEFRDAVGQPQSQMCAGCHDVSLLIDGAMRSNVAPTDDRAHAGITCRVCHGIEDATLDGNGS